MKQFIQYKFMFTAFIFLIVPVTYVLAQENASTTVSSTTVQSTQAQYGIFNQIADWGTEEFPPQLGQHKVPGKVEVSLENEDTVYDIYGNGDDIWAAADEGIYLYTEKSGSWRISAKAFWIHNGRKNYSLFGNRPDAGVHIRSHPKLPSSVNFRNYLRVGSFGPQFGNNCTGWRPTQGAETRNWINVGTDGEYLYEKGEGLYLRVTRVAAMNYFFSEWSYDGVNWGFGYGMYIELPETLAYGLSVTNTADNKMLGHARFSEVKLEPAPPVAKRLVASNSYRPKENTEVIIQIHNNTNASQSVEVIERIPEEWTVLETTLQPEEKYRSLQWKLDLKPGINQIGYLLRAPDEYNGPAVFSGTVNGMSIFGVAEILDSLVPVTSMRNFITFRVLFVTAPVVMFLLHIIIFLFNPKLKEHLYYSLFLASATALIYLLTEETVSLSDIHFQWHRATFFSSFSLGMLMLFFYTLVFDKLPIQFWVFMGSSLFFSVMLNTNQAFYYMGFYNLVFSIGVLECFRVVLIGFKKDLKGFSILAVGVVIYGVSWFWVYMNYYIQLPSPGVSTVPFAVLILMFCMSIYLSSWFSRLYQNLAVLTVELEDRVERRTSELSNANQQLESTVHELEAAKENAENANRAKSNFLARMSHEIRTPLTGLLGMIELLHKTNINETQDRYLQSAGHSGESLLNVINEILDVSKIEADKLELELCPVNLHDLLQSVTDSLMALANQKGITLSYTYQPDHHEHFLCDQNRVKQIFVNLLGNAIKFTHQGAVSLQVTATPGGSNKLAFECVVNDTGIGIREEVKQSIFEAFTQADESTTRQFGGTGLGLAISKRLIELMGGQIQVESEYGKGSTFSVFLTFEKVDSQDEVMQSRQMVEEQPVSAHVLIAEDDPVVNKITQEMLTQLECSYVLAVNGIEAVKEFKSQHFDIVLLDYHMPVMDGLEAAQLIRQIESDDIQSGVKNDEDRVPIIAVTANVDGKYRDECLKAGMNDLLCKPFKMNELSEILHKWHKKN